MKNIFLWKSIDHYHPDKPGVAMPFSRRLAIENGWSRRYALRAIEEYKRFMYLACVIGQPVTPSEEIDQVWHLHLVYSRAYWEDFCGQVLGKSLHHSPTEGGSNEDQKYHLQYEQTLAAYRQEFEQEPPHDIWPASDKRFKGGLWRWVNLSKYWVLRKPF
jgi:hypothetical protein